MSSGKHFHNVLCLSEAKGMDIIMNDFSKDTKIFKALCDTKRLTILDYLKSGEKCACVLIENMNIGQSALSYHMKILCDSGIVNARG